MTLQDVAAFTAPIYDILKPLIVPTLMAGAWAVVAELKRRGYQATYATAIVRAMGAGVMAAKDQGRDPFSLEGRKIVTGVGAEYLMEHVGEAGAALGIETMQGHAERVLAQVGVVQAQAAAVVSSLGPASVLIDSTEATSIGEHT